MTTNRYQQQRYLLMTLDPVHPGAGGYRLGRVDNSIIREPGTRLPKIPGSSLHGAVRQYAAYHYGTPEAAGQKQDKIEKPDENPVCYTFGYVKGKSAEGTQQAFSGVVSIYDARILLFPVHTLNGPYWVTTVGLLAEAGFKHLPAEPQKDDKIILPQNSKSLTRLNLGWLLLEASTAAESLKPPAKWEETDTWQQVAGRIAIISESLFPTIVNSNLEVRTSVAINPETGAAEDTALFTYEAIPRATFLTCDVVLDDYRREKFPSKNDWNTPLDLVHTGLEMMQYLGVGGMGTRGFGRVKTIGKPVEENFFQEEKE